MNNNLKPATMGGDAEETLRLIARLPAPEGLEDRVHAAVRKAPQSARVLPWPASPRWMHGAIARGAAAAAIVCVVAGGGWAVYSRVQPLTVPRVIAMPRVAPGGGFSSANAMRTPTTLNGPTLTHPVASPKRAKKRAAHKQGSSTVRVTPATRQ
ncbi:MAG: hypothetical protein WCC26_07335 [Terracidiphilus sp.]